MDKRCVLWNFRLEGSNKCIANGKCIIDVIKHPVQQSGSASFNQIYDVAYFLVHECVMGDGIGGYATNIGKLLAVFSLSRALKVVGNVSLVL